MTSPESTRAVHSIVFILPAPVAANSVAAATVPDAAAGTATERLIALINEALASSRAGAEKVLAVEFGAAAVFLNSGASINFVRVLQQIAEAPDGMSLRIGVHMGSLGGTDAQMAKSPPMRLARQIALLAQNGQALASPLFHNFVTQFDHRCKSMLHAVPPVTDSQGRDVSAFEVRFDGLPALHTPAAQSAPDTPLIDPVTLPPHAEQRLLFLEKVERVLAQEIGPLAGLVVRQAAETASSRAAFYRIVGDTLPEAVDRAEFFRMLDRI